MHSGMGPNGRENQGSGNSDLWKKIETGPGRCFWAYLMRLSSFFFKKSEKQLDSLGPWGWHENKLYTLYIYYIYNSLYSYATWLDFETLVTIKKSGKIDEFFRVVTKIFPYQIFPWLLTFCTFQFPTNKLFPNIFPT